MSPGVPTPSPNFAFLAYHDTRLVALGTQAEQHFAGDPTVCLFKLRQFGEVLAKHAAAQVGLVLEPRDSQQYVIERLWERGAISAQQKQLFHDLRRAGNDAVHESKGLPVPVARHRSRARRARRRVPPRLLAASSTRNCERAAGRRTPRRSSARPSSSTPTARR